MEDGKRVPRLPIAGNRKILITSALPNVKNVPHVGDIIECVLSADVYARYCRLRGYNALYICGTDEFRTAKHIAIHKEVYDWFDISFDKFGRTSTPEHVCHAIFNSCLSENPMQQLYYYTCNKFLADRLVEGSCPFGGCNYDSACGDQCEKCGKLLNPTQLKDPRCKVGYACLRHGHHAPENVELYQFLGKDNVPFHTVMFPTTQLGTGGNGARTKTISLNGYLNYEKGKFSKSKGVGVFGNDVKDTNIPVEVWRYCLLINRPEVSDSTFKWEDLQVKLNEELLSNLGNFVNRVVSFIAKPENAGYGSVIPDAESHLPTMSLGGKVGKLVKEYVKALEKVKLKQGLKAAMFITGAE